MLLTFVGIAVMQMEHFLLYTVALAFVPRPILSISISHVEKHVCNDEKLEESGDEGCCSTLAVYQYNTINVSTYLSYTLKCPLALKSN